jgi:DNA-binding response OmpR family regulator
MHPLIFLVDDDPMIRTLVELRLGVAGYTVMSAEDGDLALRRLQTLTPALIILDLQMPRMDGLAVLKLLTQDRRLDHTPIMMLTVSADAADVSAAAALGVTAYVLKPFNPDILAGRVRRLVEAPRTARRPPDPADQAAPIKGAPLPDAGPDVIELDI